MSIFKKKIDFSQFLADLISVKFEFLENNFEKLIILADEFRVLSEKDKEEFLDKAHELMMVDILVSCNQNFYNNLSSEEVGKAVSIMYARYLIEYKKVPKPLVEIKIDNSMKLFELVLKAEEDMQKQNEQNKKIGRDFLYEFGNEIEKQRYCLCRGFSGYYAGDDIKSENWEGKNFAAFKFAKAFVKTDIVKTALKDFKIIWN